MRIKSSLKKLVGAERLSKLKGIACHYACCAKFAVSGKHRLWTDNTVLTPKRELSEKKYHVFRGYYDINYLNGDGKRFLCHRLPVQAGKNKDTACEVGYYDLDTGEFTKISETRAWCWQQGSRLRWLNPTQIIFNAVSDGQYCSEIYDVNTRERVKRLDWPLYDFTPDFQYGLTLNFSRLQRLRPGYGYDYLDDETKDSNAPENDGILLADLARGKSRVLYSLDQLSEAVENGQDYVHYVNHICVSPSGKNFIFFHIYVKPGKKGWQTVLYVSDIQGTSLKALEKEDRVSHYCWIDEKHLMVTCHKENGEEYYCTYNIDTAEKTILKIAELCVDGHPGRVGTSELFLTDTYPQKNGIQMLRIFRMADTHAQTIASVYHDYRLRGEKRCDLHPSIPEDGRMVSIDTTYHGKRRSILIFDLIKG